jgi:hypothetical protein
MAILEFFNLNGKSIDYEKWEEQLNILLEIIAIIEFQCGCYREEFGDFFYLSEWESDEGAIFWNVPCQLNILGESFKIFTLFGRIY